MWFCGLRFFHGLNLGFTVIPVARIEERDQNFIISRILFNSTSVDIYKLHVLALHS